MSEPITYGAIENALVTPDYPLDQAAEEMRLATVRRMVKRGVARRERLERLLRESPCGQARSW